MASKSSDELIQLAIEHHRRGDLRAAERIYQQLLQADPSNPDALHLLGVVAYQSGRNDRAVELIQQAIAVNPGVPDYYGNLGNALRVLGKLDEAMSAFHKALKLSPRFMEAHNNMGLVLRDRGRSNEAVPCFRKALKCNPDLPEVHNNLGMALLDQGKTAEAICCFQNALQLRPSYAEAYSNLGLAYKNEQRNEEAMRCYQDALRLNPALPEAHNNLGLLHGEEGRVQDAADCFTEAARLNPSMVEVHVNAGALYHEAGALQEAGRHYERALGLKPDNIAALWGRCMAQLEILHDRSEGVASSRQRYREHLEGLVRAVTLDNPGRIQAASKIVGSAQPFYLAYQDENDRDLQRLYGDLVCRIQAARYPQWSRPRAMPPTAAGGRLRVGIVSGFFCYHSNWKIPIKGWIENLDARRFALYGYHTGKKKDAETEVARKSFVRFFEGPAPVEEFCRAIAADRLHVLIYPEVGMNPMAAQLAALRLAPVQCASWGHPDTSGLPTMDYYLSSELMEPADADEHYTERLIRLPNLSIHYTAPQIQAARDDRSAFGLRQDAIVYFCAQSLFKYLPQHDHIFPRIALEAGDCQFAFLQYGKCREINERFTARLGRAFAEYGLRADRCVSLLPQQDPAHYQALNRLADVFLDSIGWSGCNSTLEAAAFGLPIVTLPGKLMRGRHTVAILGMMGIEETIAESLEEYVRIAVRLAKDSAWRKHISEATRLNVNRVCRDMDCIRGLEIFLEKAVATALRV